MHAKLQTQIQNAAGLQLLVKDRNVPILEIGLPGHKDGSPAITVFFPEHITARKRGQITPEHLYLRWGVHSNHPLWRQEEQFCEYERRLNGVHMVARATLESDGVRFRYEFTNESDDNYDMIYAVTDPRLTAVFPDHRLERTYVHHADGFELLASETPERLSLPLDQWLPCRYTAPFTWPMPSELKEQREERVTCYTKSRRVDQPLIATVSADGSWVVATFAREAGNVWTNPQHTCHHADPQIPLLSGEQRTVEVKVLVFQGTLDQALERVAQQRSTLEAGNIT